MNIILAAITTSGVRASAHTLKRKIKAMGKQETITYECDDEFCNKLATLDKKDEVLPAGWVLIASFKAVVKGKENVDGEALYFCSDKHAKTWFESTINFPTMEEADA